MEKNKHKKWSLAIFQNVREVVGCWPLKKKIKSKAATGEFRGEPWRPGE